MMDLARELMPRALAVALSFSRGAGFVAVSPFPGGQAGPKARVGLAVMLAWVASSLSPASAELTTLDGRAVSSVASELGIGLMIGMAFRFVLSAGEILGQNLSQATVLSTPAGFNPMLSTQESALGQVISYFAMLVAVSIGAHRVALAWLRESVRLLPVGTAVHLDAAAGTFVDLAADALAVGLRLSLPVVAVTLATQVALAMIARAAPALQIFSIGLSILVAAGVMVLVASMGDIAMGLSEHIGSLSSRLEQLLVLIAPQPP